MAPVLMPYRLEVLGFPRLRNSDGSEVEFPRGKPLALLSFLAVEGRPVGRDELGELFWPGNSQKRTRHSVRQAIWLIRRTLGEEILQGDDPVAVSGEALSCDLLEFQGALEAGKIDHARSLWRGPLLSRMSLSGCRGWDHWLEEKRGGLDRDFFRVLLSQARTSSGAHDDEHALECLDQALELNPFSVEGHKLRIETLLDLRQIPRALKALEEAEEEIGDDPRIREELDQLRKRITLQENTDGSEASERLGESVEFVGRSGELADLRGAWRRARAGVSGTACILGPTGIGKTRLAAELLAGIERDGGRIAKARGFRGEHRIPWGTVADLIQELMLLPGVKGISSGSEAVLRSVLPSLSKNGSDTHNSNGSGEIQSAALSDAVSDLIEAVGFEVPLVIFLDDWQWVDKESRAVLGKAMRRVRGLACLFLLAERTGERRLLQEGAESLVEELGGRRIPLGPLSESELGELLGLLAEFEDQDEAGNLVGLIHEVTGGNPLFVGEVLRKLADDGIYQLEEGRWILRAGKIGPKLDLPESVQGLIRDRLGRLSSTAAQVAGALSRERRSVPAGMLRRRSGLDEAVFTRAMGELVDREVLTWVGPTEVDFAHDQLREAAGIYFKSPGRRTILESARKQPILAGLAAVAALAGVFFVGTQFTRMVSGSPESTQPDYPFGEGTIILRGDTLIEVIPPAWEGGEWTWGRADLFKPVHVGPQTDGPLLTPDGRVRWFGEETLRDESETADDPPRILEFHPDGTESVFFEGPGDTGLQDLAPSGDVAILAMEDTSAPTYRQMLVRVDRPGGEPEVLYRPPEFLYGADWSPDGQKIAAIVSGAPDTLLIIAPDGTELTRFPMTGHRMALRPNWCGDSRHLTLWIQGLRPGLGLLVDVESDTMRLYGEELYATSNHLCLGDGRGALFLGIGDDGPGVFLQDFQSDSSTLILPLPDGEEWIPVWLPNQVESPAWGIKLAGGNRSLEWGYTDTLEALTTRADGTLVSSPIEWTSSDPSIAYVNEDGVVTGNRTGEAWITATSAGWIGDSIRITVQETQDGPTDVLFRESFETGDLSKWTVSDSTFPAPIVIREEDGNVLSLRGDGRYRDFILSREGFPLQQGATLEMDFRLPLERDDKERFIACLRGESALPGNDGSSTSVGDYCFQYPSTELTKREDNLIHVMAGKQFFSFEADAEVALPSRDWVHLALQVRPDGRVSVLINRNVVSETRYPFPGHSGTTWKIELAGASVDTELLVRNLTLWRGERFPLDEGIEEEADPGGSASGQEIGGG